LLNQNAYLPLTQPFIAKAPTRRLDTSNACSTLGLRYPLIFETGNPLYEE